MQLWNQIKWHLAMCHKANATPMETIIYTWGGAQSMIQTNLKVLEETGQT